MNRQETHNNAIDENLHCYELGDRVTVYEKTYMEQDNLSCYSYCVILRKLLNL